MLKIGFRLQNAYFYISLSVLFLIASSLVFHMIFFSDAFDWVPRWTHHQLLVTGVRFCIFLYTFFNTKCLKIILSLQCLGFVCSLESAVISCIQKCKLGQYEPVDEDLSFHLQERHPVSSRQDSPPKVNQTTHNYKPINYQPIASTSKVETTNYLVDDVQPCSSKNSDPYRLVW